MVLLGGRNTVASFLGWQTTLNVMPRLVARMDIEAARGAQVRARARWVEEGETSPAFSLRFEKKRAADRFVTALHTDNGSIVSHSDDLCHGFSSFYVSLFTAEATDPVIANSLLGNVSFALPPTQADL